jgi:GT2 family glycosyltransferase
MSSAAHPTISVIIPTYNRKDVVVACLRALFAQSLDGDLFEVIVVDDGSTDGTAAAVGALVPAWGGRLVCRRQENAGANAARNLGIGIARGALLVIINDDSIAVSGFLAEHLRTHREHPDEAVAVLGRMTVAPEVPFSPVAALHIDASYVPLAGRAELAWTAFFTCNISVKKSFLLRHGLFDTTIRWHEDIELGQRLRHHGLRVLYNPAALAFHLHHLSVDDLMRIGEKEGQALARWYRRQPALLETLVGLGLRTRAFPARSLRYAFADALVNERTLGAWLRLAAVAHRLSPSVAHRIYRAAFSSRKRAAIAAALAEPGNADGGTLLLTRIAEN